MEKLVLIDGNSLLHRAYYATPILTTKSGVPTNAVYAFINMFIKLINEVKPKYVRVAFDLKAPTFRHKMYDMYKGTRKSMPDDLVPQVPLLKKVLKALNVNYVEYEGYEADDLIATTASNLDIDTIIITGDRDSFQLVNNSTSIYFTKRGISEIEEYNINNFEEKLKINPNQVIELKALMGDASDNIPGVSGVGEKTALNLIQTYKNIEGVYQNIDQIKGKLRERLESDKEKAYLSRTLATVKRDCEISLDLAEMEFKLPFTNEARELLKELEFKTLVKKDDLFEENKNFGIEETDIELKEINSIEELKNVITKNELSIDVNGGMNIYTYEGIEYKIKIKEGFFGEGLNESEVYEVLKDAFESSTKKIIVYDKKSLKHQLKEYNITLDAECDDLSILKYLVDYTGGGASLNNILEEYSKDIKLKASAIAQIAKTLKDKAKEWGMYDLYKKIELPLVDVLYDMEVQGFKIDIEVLNELSAKYQKELIEIEKRIYELAGEKFNINSPKQLSVILFEKLMLTHGKKNKNHYSTSAEFLEEIEAAHEIVPKILQYRKIKKLLSTYIEGFRPLINKSTGLIHTSFNQVVTSTGRLSSKEPNLQNIPVRDEGKEIRKMFIAKSENHILVGADYSQIELRLMAHFSNSQKLIEAFNNEEDIHSSTAAEVFGVNKEEVTKEMRRKAKVVNFGIIYGISEYGLAKNLKCTPKEAREYIKTYFEKYSEVKEYMNRSVESAMKSGYAETILKRRRYIKELESSSYQVKEFGKRAAMNMPLQGSSADIIKVAMVNVYNRLNKENLKSKLVLQIHDELIIDALKSEQEKVTKILVEEMENAVKLKVKLTVSPEVGERWYDAK